MGYNAKKSMRNQQMHSSIIYWPINYRTVHLLVLRKFFHSIAHIWVEIRCENIPKGAATVDGEYFILADIVSVCVLLIKCVYLKGALQNYILKE